MVTLLSKEESVFRQTLRKGVRVFTREVDNPLDRIKKLIGMFRAVLEEDNRMCLCGMLAADAELLSAEARFEVKKFFDKSIDWLTKEWTNLGCENPRERAVDTFVRLEGALLIARITASSEPLDIIEKAIIEK